ncbi:MAG: drug/metabolite transporter (DMT)-like permease [Patiriisocius sp.]|jgi:drug/metabolite transporter (DMT)-like permease
MFKRITGYKGFWRSVGMLTLAFAIVFFGVQWAFTGFNSGFLDVSLRTVLALLLGGFIYGFLMTYGKFWGKLKEKDHKNK